MSTVRCNRRRLQSIPKLGSFLPRNAVAGSPVPPGTSVDVWTIVPEARGPVPQKRAERQAGAGPRQASGRSGGGIGRKSTTTPRSGSTSTGWGSATAFPSSRPELGDVGTSGARDAGTCGAPASLMSRGCWAGVSGCDCGSRSLGCDGLGMPSSVCKEPNTMPATSFRPLAKASRTCTRARTSSRAARRVSSAVAFALASCSVDRRSASAARCSA